MLAYKLTKNAMNLLLYAIIFVCGAMFGSFYTLATYRIPKNVDIVKKHSYCPNCNHKLGVLDLVPILSYIFLGGKCRYCKQKIRPRYLILEILSGIMFVLLAYTLKINAYTLNLQQIILFAFMILYFTAVILISAIDKEYRNINKKVLAYGIIISLLYMIYLYVIEPTSIYRYAIYLAVYITLITTDTFMLRKFAEENYIINLVIFFTMITMFVEYKISTIVLIIFLIEIIFYLIIKNLRKSKNGNKPIKFEEIPLGFYLGVSNILTIFIMNIINLFI